MDNQNCCITQEVDEQPADTCTQLMAEVELSAAQPDLADNNSKKSKAAKKAGDAKLSKELKNQYKSIQ